MNSRRHVAHLIVGLVVCCSTVMAEPFASNWLGFRGDGTSASETSGPAALTIGDDGTRSWKREMPGRSVASPIVIGDLVVSTSSEGPDEENLFVTGVDLATGETRWQRMFRATGRPFFHPTSAGAAPSLASDGESIIAFYSSNDLICLGIDGSFRWMRGLGFDYPKAGNDIGMASSPVIAGGTVVVLVENQGESFASGLDLQSGENLWRLDRPAASNWSSPVVVGTPTDATSVIFQSRSDVVAVDPVSGLTQWSLDEGRAAVASPTRINDTLLLPGDDLLAVKLTAPDETPVELWRDGKLSPRNASVVTKDDRLYSLKGSVLIAATLEDGETIWKTRLSGLGGTWATPVVADNRIYVFDQSGKGLVVEDSGDAAEVVSEVELEEGVLGTPAIASGYLIVRSRTMLHCFASENR